MRDRVMVFSSITSATSFAIRPKYLVITFNGAMLASIVDPSTSLVTPKYVNRVDSGFVRSNGHA